MRLNFRRNPDPPPSADAQDRFWKEWETPADRPLSEFNDPLDAQLYLMHKLREARAEGDQDKARRLAVEGTRRFPRDPHLRQLAADTFQRLGEPAEAMAQLMTAIAVAPDFCTAYPRLARLLHDRGDRGAALSILEAGWKYRQREVRRGDRAAEKVEYFSVLEGLPSAGGD